MKRQSFFMVYMEDCSTPTYRHATIEGAENEAKRLARLHNRKTFVLCSVKSFKVNEFTVEDCRPETDELPF